MIKTNKNISKGLIATLLIGNCFYLMSYYSILFDHESGIENLFKIALVYSLILILFWFTRNNPKAKS
jgi:hypothetical protein